MAATVFVWDQGWDVKVFPDDTRYLLDLKSVQPGMPCYTVGCPNGLTGFSPGRMLPLVLDGIVCGTDPEHERLYVSAPTFEGNSGGPLFVAQYWDGEKQLLGPKFHWAGVMIQKLVSAPMIPGTDPGGQNAWPSLHLGVATSVTAVRELLRSPPARADLVQAKAIAERESRKPPSGS